MLGRVQTPGYVPKKPGGFFWVHPPKNPHFFLLVQKYPNKTEKTQQDPKNPLGWAFLKKKRFFEP